MMDIYKDEEAAQEAMDTIVARFAARMRKEARGIVEETIGEVETEFLPTLSTDLWLNVHTFAEQVINEWASGRGDVDGFDLFGGVGRATRDAIYRENKEAIHAAIGADLAEEIEQLKSLAEFLRGLR